MGENDTSKHNTSTIITHCICGQFLGPEEMNDTCRKIIHTGVMDRGLTAFTQFSNPFLHTISTNKNFENITSAKLKIGNVQCHHDCDY